jgi:hypothetical protein
MVFSMKIIVFMRVTLLKASPRHGGDGGFFKNFQVLICRETAPPGASSFIVQGDIPASISHHI